MYMAKTKISFDIDKTDYEKIKLVVKATHLTQGDFLRRIVHNALKEFDDKVMTVYVIENQSLTRKVIDKSEYTIEVDESAENKDLMKDFSFIKSGFLVKNGVRTRFYSKVMI